MKINMNGKTIFEIVLFFLVLAGTAFASTRITDTYVNTTGTMNASHLMEGNEWLEDKYVQADDWTTIDDYPAACSTGQAVTGLGDTLTCSAFQNGTELFNTTPQILAVTNNTADWRATNFYGALSCAYLTGNTSDLCSLVDTDNYNTTAQISAAANSTGVRWANDTANLGGHLATAYLLLSGGTMTGTLAFASSPFTIAVSTMIANLNASYANNSYFLDGLPPSYYVNTTEQVQDAAGAMATSGDGVDLTYDDGANTLTPGFDCSDVAGTGLSCSGEDLITNLADAQVPDDITISAAGKNVTTTGAFVSDADNEGFWDGDGQDFRMYWNGTCEIMENIASGSSWAIC